MASSTPTPDCPYIRAAKIIARGGNKTEYGYDGACDVLHCKPYADANDETWKIRGRFHATFVEPDGFYLVTTVIPEIKEAQRWRVLALCFMSAMVETGDA